MREQRQCHASIYLSIYLSVCERIYAISIDFTKETDQMAKSAKENKNDEKHTHTHDIHFNRWLRSCSSNGCINELRFSTGFFLFCYEMWRAAMFEIDKKLPFDACCIWKKNVFTVIIKRISVRSIAGKSTPFFIFSICVHVCCHIKLL